jgi:hypothetical protein
MAAVFAVVATIPSFQQFPGLKPREQGMDPAQIERGRQRGRK